MEYRIQLYCVHGQRLGRGTFTGHSPAARSSNASFHWSHNQWSVLAFCCPLQCRVHDTFTHALTFELIVERTQEMMPCYLNIILHFSAVSSLPVEIFIDPPQLTTPSPLVCPSKQWFCPNDHADQHSGGNEQRSGECISEHSACNGRCPTPALWWASSTKQSKGLS